MDCFIKKIFSGTHDESVHLQFQKFSRGTFTDRALIKVTASPKGFALTTSNEYANELVRIVASALGAKKTQVTGVIVSTTNLSGKVPSTDLKQFMGIKQYVIDGEMTGQEIVALLDMLPEAFFALTFNAGTTLLKIKPKAPKSAKPKTSDAPAKPDFCSVKTTDAKIISHFLFDMPVTWKSFSANHTFIINDIELPHGVSNPNEIRRLAKRKGTIVRKMILDGKEMTSEHAFVA